MTIEENILKAIAAHTRWKKLLLVAVETGQCDISAKTASDNNSCGFGKWLHSSPEAKASPHYKRVDLLHTQFHQYAGEILSLALAGNRAEAKKLMEIESNSGFITTSTQLINELGHWHNGK